MAGAEERAHRALRPRPDAQRPRFRCPGRGARVRCPRRLPGHAGPRPERWLSDPMAYSLPALSRRHGGADRAARRRDGRSGSAPRWAASSACCWRRCRESPIRRLVINDVGPLIAKRGLERIRRYVGLDPSFADLAALEAALRRISAASARLTDAIGARWRRTARGRKPDGRLGFDLRSQIAAPLQKGWFVRDIDLWQYWTRSRARCWSCAARNPTFCARPTPWR